MPSLTHGGFLWFPDLTSADPTWGLPILTSAILLLSAELGSADGMQGQPADTVARLKWGMRAISVILIPVTLSMPAVRVWAICWKAAQCLIWCTWLPSQPTSH